MKKLKITTFIILCISMLSYSQEYGIKGGVNFATLSGDTSGLESRTAIHLGVVMEIPFTETLSLQPELLYSSQGAKDSEFDESLKMDYLTLPVMLKFYAVPNLSFELGPQFGLLLSAKTEFDGEDDEDVKDEFRDIDLAVNFGVGYKLETGLNFGARYSLGLSNVEDYLDDFFSDYKAHNSVFQIFVGYLF